MNLHAVVDCCKDIMFKYFSIMSIFIYWTQDFLKSLFKLDVSFDINMILIFYSLK